MTSEHGNEGFDLGAVFDAHVEAEFAAHDADAAIDTMSSDPYLNHVPVATGASGRRVELPHAVVVGFERGKVAYENVYWDQATVLVQIGLLDPTGLPVLGVEQAEKVLDPTRPSSALLDSA